MMTLSRCDSYLAAIFTISSIMSNILHGSRAKSGKRVMGSLREGRGPKDRSVYYRCSATKVPLNAMMIQRMDGLLSWLSHCDCFVMIRCLCASVRCDCGCCAGIPGNTGSANRCRKCTIQP
eukprot:scaffold37257_cov54-Attheya_sp.AAC.4